MSATLGVPLPESTPLQSRLTDYLSARLTANEDTLFIKSKHIAGNLDASTKEIGVTMAALEEAASTPFRISRHGGASDGTTWRVEKRE